MSKSGCCGSDASEVQVLEPAGEPCCGSSPARRDDVDVKQVVQERYARLATVERDASCCGASESDRAYAEALYSAEELASLPSEVMEMSMGCGNPTAIAGLQPGEVVLDLGCGGGIDVFLAAQKVGPEGKAIGLDMTMEMIAQARRNAARMGATNVEFRLGEMECMPVLDETVDVVISNCVINLSPDKDKVFSEAYRVLKPGGRIAVSDVVTLGDLPETIAGNISAWSSCIGGALREEDYLGKMRQAGFERVAVESRHVYTAEELGMFKECDSDVFDDALTAEELATLEGTVASIRVVAHKPNNTGTGTAHLANVAQA